LTGTDLSYDDLASAELDGETMPSGKSYVSKPGNEEYETIKRIREENATRIPSLMETKGQEANTTFGE